MVGFFIILPILGLVCLEVLGLGVVIPSFMEGRRRAQEAAASRTNMASGQSQVEDRRTNAPSPAFQKIEGAFGKKFGEVFHPAQARYTKKLPSGTLIYEFTPSTGFRSFNLYYVAITPTTHKIHSIWGMGSAENRRAAQKEQAVIMELLKQKYGVEEEEGLFNTADDAKRVAQDDRHITIQISDSSDVTLVIIYYDGELKKLAEEERLASEIKKVGKTGL